MRRSFAKLGVGFVVCTALMPGLAGPAHAEGGANLSVTATWVGSGVPRAALGQTVTYAVTLKNLGPNTSTGTYLFALTPDPFNPVSLTCSDPSFCSSPGGELAAGASVNATVVEVVCCFPKWQSRTTSAGATVFSDADPNAANDFASVLTKIVGPHGFFPAG